MIQSLTIPHSDPIDQRMTRSNQALTLGVTRWMVENYGISKQCRGCKYVTGEISGYAGHSDYCRKRFLELAEEPGNEYLKVQIDKAMERMTRRFLDMDNNVPKHDKREKRQAVDIPPSLGTITLAEANGKIFAATKPILFGQKALLLIQNSYLLQLDGQEETYHKIWKNILEKVAP